MVIDFDCEWNDKLRMKPVIKKKGIEQPFDERKIYASCYAACLNVPLRHDEAHKICNNVCRDIHGWMEGKPVITTDRLFLEMIKAIRKYSKEAAYMYETHRDVS